MPLRKRLLSNRAKNPQEVPHEKHSLFFRLAPELCQIIWRLRLEPNDVRMAHFHIYYKIHDD
jgi:hypothetical protein